MKSVVIVACCILAVNALSDNELWVQYKEEHNKIYDTVGEEERRFNIFLANKKKIEQHNARYEAGLETYYMGFTRFADMTQEEFVKFLGGPKIHPRSDRDTIYQRVNYSVPDNVDWRQKGVVTPVENQACGDCWAHSTTGVTEGQYALKHKKLVVLSRQNLIDCTFDYGNGGCDGGYLYTSYNYLHDHGIESESDYPYEGKNGNCRFNAGKVVTKISSAVFFAQNDENALKEGVATKGPISIVMDASYIGLYKGGVYTDNQCTSTNLNHGVLIVGYGIQDGLDYWLIKNSWGTGFGEAGYIKLRRNANNMCGVARDPSYPIIA